MINRTQGQILIFIAFVFCGAFLGFLYSLFFFKKTKNKVISAIIDFVYGVICCCFIFVFFDKLICFDVAFFDFFGIFLGFLVYKLLFWKTLDSVFNELYNKIVKYTKGVITKYANERKNNKVHHCFGGRLDICFGACDDYPYLSKGTAQLKGKTTSRTVGRIKRIKRRNRRRSGWRISFNS